MLVLQHNDSYKENLRKMQIGIRGEVMNLE